MKNEEEGEIGGTLVVYHQICSRKFKLVAIFIDNHQDVNTYTANTNKDTDNFD